jgi:hypothetical protein
VRREMQRNAELVSIGTHPAWPVMREEVHAKRVEYERRVLKQALSIDGVDQRDIDYCRGFLAGLIWLASLPDGAERELERALAEQVTQTDEEDAA